MKKSFFIIIASLLITVAVGYFLLYSQTDLFVAHYRTSDYPQAYYQNLAKQCESKESIGCCLASVKAMQNGGYQLAIEGKCAEGYKPAMMQCIDSYQWCEL